MFIIRDSTLFHSTNILQFLCNPVIFLTCEYFMASKIPKSSSLQYYKRQYYVVATNVRFRARFPGLSFCHTPNVRLPTFPHW